ncbi:membrane protein insertase YidC [Candidatus Uhrbacteria bacterium]|nr:membrane protein insertase YidC [Candidatus Uhrbacteria bacterium]
MSIYTTIFYQPMFNALIWFYNVVPGKDIGLAIVLLTALLKILLWPFSIQSLKSQKAMTELQPKLKELQEKYKGKKEELAKATMLLYSKEKVSPFSSCLPLLVQLPFLIALYQVLRDGLASKKFELLYSFISNPGQVDPTFFGILNLAAPNFILALLAGGAQFLQSKMLSTRRPPRSVAGKEGSKDEDTMARMNKQMTYMMPAITVVISAGLPAGLALYWLISSLLTVGQQALFLRTRHKP